MVGRLKGAGKNNTADGKTVTTVIVILRIDIRRVRIQVATIRGGIASSRPPVAICGTIVDVAIRAIVVARTEKVTEFTVV